MNICRKITILFFLLKGISLQAMEKSSIDPENAFQRIHPSVYGERLKGAALVCFPWAQQMKYGKEDADSTVMEVYQEVIHNESMQKESDEVSVKKMNAFMTKKLSASGVNVLGIKGLFGEKGIWINQEYFKSQPHDVQKYLITCALSQTELSHPEMTTMAISEGLVAVTSVALFKKAKLVKQMMREKGIVSPRKFYSFSSMFYYEDPTIKSKFFKRAIFMRPGVYEGSAWFVAFTGPLLVLPNTDLEKTVFKGHKLSGIEHATKQDSHFSTLALMVDRINFKENDNQARLPQDELDYIEIVVEQRRAAIKKEHEKKTFNFYGCTDECRGKECDCKKRFFETKNLSCMLMLNECLQECQKKVKRNPSAGLKIRGNNGEK